MVMKRCVLALVAVFALLFTVQTAKADWYVSVASTGWVLWEHDGTFGDDDFDPPLPPPLPPGTRYFFLLDFDSWYLVTY